MQPRMMKCSFTCIVKMQQTDYSTEQQQVDLKAQLVYHWIQTHKRFKITLFIMTKHNM